MCSVSEVVWWGRKEKMSQCFGRFCCSTDYIAEKWTFFICQLVLNKEVKEMMGSKRFYYDRYMGRVGRVKIELLKNLHPSWTD